MIEVRDLTHIYRADSPEPVAALAGVDFTLEEGEYVALVGPNGCGKSTLARHLNALLLPTSGSVTVDGFATSDADSVWEVRRRVGMVFQDPRRQLVATTVEQDVAFGPENLGLEPEEIRRRIGWALSALEIEALRCCEPHLLSGGQVQRVAIASVLAMQPRYLVLDEPTTMLDPVGRREVLQAVDRLHREQGLAVLYVTHRMEEILAARRVVVLEGGRVAFQGTPAEVFSRLEELRGMGLDVPPIADLAGRLRRHGVALPPEVWDARVLADWLEAAWKARLG